MTDMVQATIFDQPRVSRPSLWSLLSASIALRAAVIALGLGSVLTLANQAGAIFGAEKLQLLPMVLVYATPFVVVAVSQLLGIQRAVLDARSGAPNRPADESFLSTVLSHGIPLRALRLGLLVGGFNAFLVIAVALQQQGGLSAVPWALLGQALCFPVLFGMLSQAVSYRRAFPHSPA